VYTDRYQCGMEEKENISKEVNDTLLGSNPQTLAHSYYKMGEFDKKMHQRKQQLQTCLQVIMTIILVILLVVMSLMCTNHENIESQIIDLKNELSNMLTTIEHQKKIEDADIVNNLRKT
jgi:hypothetical protein